MYDDIIEITGAVEPDPQNNPFPKQFGMTGLYFAFAFAFVLFHSFFSPFFFSNSCCVFISAKGGAQKGFAKPPLNLINVDK